MSICQVCHQNNKRPSAHSHLTKEFYEVLILPLKYVAERCGYALATHGSLGFDIDLVACPWRDHCVDADYLAEELRKTAEQIIGVARKQEGDPNPTKKPCGRLAYSFYLCAPGDRGPYIDLSVMPVGTHKKED